MSPFRALQDIRTMNLLFTAAEKESQAAGDDRPGPEHLVLAALGLPDGTARRAFDAAGVSEAAYRAAVDAVHAHALSAIGITAPPAPSPLSVPAPRGAFRLTDPGQRVFHAAVAATKQSKRVPLRGAHILLAACELTQGPFPRALAHLGVDPTTLADAAREQLAPQ
jgi:hypothetical protein